MIKFPSSCHPDITSVADWAFKIKYLSNHYPGLQGLRHSTSQIRPTVSWANCEFSGCVVGWHSSFTDVTRTNLRAIWMAGMCWQARRTQPTSYNKQTMSSTQNSFSGSVRALSSYRGFPLYGSSTRSQRQMEGGWWVEAGEKGRQAGRQTPTDLFCCTLYLMRKALYATINGEGKKKKKKKESKPCYYMVSYY